MVGCNSMNGSTDWDAGGPDGSGTDATVGVDALHEAATVVHHDATADIAHPNDMGSGATCPQTCNVDLNCQNACPAAASGLTYCCVANQCIQLNGACPSSGSDGGSPIPDVGFSIPDVFQSCTTSSDCSNGDCCFQGLCLPSEVCGFLGGDGGGFPFPDVGIPILDGGFPIPDAGFPIPDAGLPFPDGFELPE